MTPVQKSNLISLRNSGLGYKAIASRLGVSVNTVKSYCRTHEDLKANILTITTDQSVCPVCGSAIQSTPGKRGKRFCSDKCRSKWWKEHKDQLNISSSHVAVCRHCGKEFVSYGSVRHIYCSHACYIAHRFGKDCT